MTRTIVLTFELGRASAHPVVPSVESPATYTHPDGSVETLMRIESAELERFAGLDGNIVMRLDGADGFIDLCLSAEAAERIGVALIRAVAMPVGDPLTPSRN